MKMFILVADNSGGALVLGGGQSEKKKTLKSACGEIPANLNAYAFPV